MSILKVNTIQDKGGNSIISSDGSGTLTLNNDALKMTPACFLTLTGDQTISDASTAQCQLNTKVFDTDNCYDTSTYNFTPTVAGKYFCNFETRFESSANTSIASTIMRIYKNGVEVIRKSNNLSVSYTRGESASVSGVVDMNGTTDYIGFYGYCNVTSGSLIFASGNNVTHATIFRIIGA